MGTNYYLEPRKADCIECGRPLEETERRHIGKSSGGWVWLWRGYESPALTAAASWFAYLAEAVGGGASIVDEYGKTVELSELARRVVNNRMSASRNSDSIHSGHAGRCGPDDILFSEFS